MPRKRFASGTGPSQRALRVGELIRHAIAEILARGEVRDETISSHIVTVPEVRMSPDLKLATVYVMPLGGRDEKAVTAALERNKRYLRGELARRLTLKFMPDLRFRLDESFDEAARIDRLLHTDRVRRDLAPPRAESEDEDDDEGTR